MSGAGKAAVQEGDWPSWAQPHWDAKYVRRVALFGWENCDRCPTCGVVRGEPCIDQRVRPTENRWRMYSPHRSRPRRRSRTTGGRGV